jgi:hypothetical protein
MSTRDCGIVSAALQYLLEKCADSKCSTGCLKHAGQGLFLLVCSLVPTVRCFEIYNDTMVDLLQRKNEAVTTSKVSSGTH